MQENSSCILQCNAFRLWQEVRRARRTDPRLREALEDDIISGRLRPGQRLDEVGMAERFGVSRTPVREALNQLAASGLVEIRPRRGHLSCCSGRAS